ncbi:hypothetical protein [Streptomyces sp. NPDC052107]
MSAARTAPTEPVLYHLAHAPNAETAKDPLGGMDVHAMNGIQEAGS